MKKQFRKLKVLSKAIDFDKFYVISFGDCGIKLQGKFDSDLISKTIKSKKWKHEISESGYVEFSHIKRSIQIVLT